MEVGKDRLKKLNSETIQCQICKVKDSIYRCPACFIRTCSLTCCKVHKEKHQCNGKRDRTAFLPLNRWTDSTVASDFHFLEDVLARSDRGKRLVKELGMNKSKQRGIGPGKRKRIEEEYDIPDVPLHPLSQLKIASEKKLEDGGMDLVHELDRGNHDATQENPRRKKLKDLVQVSDKQGNGKEVGKDKELTKSSPAYDPYKSQYPKHKMRLVQKAKERNITLLLMPPGMQRHIMNKTTKYDIKSDTIHWKVEIIFHIMSMNKVGDDSSGSGENKPTKTIITLDRVPENCNVHQYLSKAFEKQVSHSAQSETRSILSKFRQGANYELKSDQAGIGEIVTMMKRIPCNSSYDRVDLRQNLRDMLRGKSIIEFPTVEIALKEDAHNFPLMIEEM